jgi:hypothetical protein
MSDDFEPRPNDFLVEPLFAPFEGGDEPGPVDDLTEAGDPAPPGEARGPWAWLLRLLGRGA